MHLPKIGDDLEVYFEGEVNEVRIEAIGLFEEPNAVEYYEVTVDPNGVPFHAELYVEDMGKFWNFC
jgi:hypothetical protein